MMTLMSDPRAVTLQGYYNSHALTYIPASLYDEHPEYYAEIDGKRVLGEPAYERAYCITNPGFVQYVTDMLKAELAGKKSDYGYRPVVGVGHADHHSSCQCAVCKASYERVGLGGTYMEFDNKVADAVAKDYPDAIVDTLAYGAISFRTTPVKMRSNVQVTWCPISVCAAHGFDECDANRDQLLLDILGGWQKNAEMMEIWYYHYQSDAFMPQMKLFATSRNFREFRKRGIQGVFVEPISASFGLRSKPVPDGDKLMPAWGGWNDQYFTIPLGMRHLTSYVACRLLWDADFDVRTGIREFCETYYGPAGKELGQVALIWESVDSYERSVGPVFSSYAGVHQDHGKAPMLKMSVVEHVDALFDRAESKVSGNATLLRRVRMARLSHQLEVLCFAPADSKLRQKAFDGFFPLMEELGITNLTRTGISDDISVENFKALVIDPAKICIPGQEKVGANLLSNSGMETEIDGDGIPDSWSARGKYMPEEYDLDPSGVSIDTAKACAGKASVRLTKKPAKNKTVVLRQQFEAKPGNLYRMSLRYQAAIKTGGFHIIFTALDKDGRFLRHQGGVRGLTDTGDDWKVLTADTTAGNDTTFLMVEALIHDDNAEGLVWIDDFTCAKIDK